MFWGLRRPQLHLSSFFFFLNRTIYLVNVCHESQMGVSHSFHRGGGTLAVILKKKNSDVIARWNLIRTLETSPSTCLPETDRCPGPATYEKEGWYCCIASLNLSSNDPPWAKLHLLMWLSNARLDNLKGVTFAAESRNCLLPLSHANMPWAKHEANWVLQCNCLDFVFVFC